MIGRFRLRPLTDGDAVRGRTPPHGAPASVILTHRQSARPEDASYCAPGNRRSTPAGVVEGQRLVTTLRRV